MYCDNFTWKIGQPRYNVFILIYCRKHGYETNVPTNCIVMSNIIEDWQATSHSEWSTMYNQIPAISRSTTQVLSCASLMYYVGYI